MRIKDGNLDGWLKNIMEAIQSHQHGVGELLMDFTENSSNLNWEVVSNSLTGGTGLTSTKYNSIDNSVTTTFDSQGYPQATELSWARTILHESIHTYVVSITNLSALTPLERQEMLGTNWLIAYINNGHGYIAESYISSMADVLQEYGQYKGYTMNRQFYEDLARGGLQGTNAFRNLPYGDRIRILNVSAVELTGNDLYGNPTTQKGSDAGC